jgi:hypothetical protein
VRDDNPVRTNVMAASMVSAKAPAASGSPPNASTSRTARPTARDSSLAPLPVSASLVRTRAAARSLFCRATLCATLSFGFSVHAIHT